MEPSTAHAIVNFLSNIKISPKSGGGGDVSNCNTNSSVEDSGVYIQQNGHSTDTYEGNENNVTNLDFVIDSSSGTGEILFNKRRLSNDSINSTNSNGGNVTGGILTSTNNSKIVKYPRRLSNDGLHSHGIHHRHHHSQRHINNKSVIKRGAGNNSNSNGNNIIISGVRPNQFDKQGLFDRINSYNITNWNIEEEELNPLVCSLYGWKCDNSRRSRNRKNELECISCHARLLIKLDSDTGNSNSNNYDILKILNGSDDEDEEDEQEEEEELGEFEYGDEHLSYSEMVRKRLVKNYLQLLKSTGHYSFCSWYFKSMSINYYKISINDINDIINNLKKNFMNLNKFKKFFQFQKIKKIKKFEKIESNFKINQKILKDFLLDTKNDSDNKDIDYNDNIYIKLILISLLNWEIKFQKFGYKVIILLKCNKCTRRILIGELSEDEFEKIMNMKDDCNDDDDKYSNLILPEVNTRPMIIRTEQKTEFDLNLDNNNNSNNDNNNNEYVSIFDDDINGHGQVNSVDEYDEYDDEEEEEGVIDLVNEHHRWCCIINESSNSEILGYELIYDMLKMSIKTDEILPQIDNKNIDNINLDGDIDMTIDEEIEFGDKSVNLSLSNLDKLRNKII